MDKKNTIKFILNYLFALLIGNLLVFMVDKVGVKYGMPPMSIGKYIFVNSVAIVIGIFITFATNKTQGKVVK
ncbi:hypothetical protein [Candidatus Clostridium radicumherbarum]|uniref:Uncharacterized protein n=1 Tax=Candidatus Clostridium radicumherbarum TaxID=3381662 RepID=A0ABW8TYD8_9CLOT